MRVNRFEGQPKRKNRSLPCGCVAFIGVLSLVTVVGVIALITYLPSLALQVAGFEVAGNTEQFFNDANSNNMTNPLPPISDTRPVNSVTINSSDGTSITLNQGLPSVNTGVDSAGIPMAQAQLDETDLQHLCQQYTTYCGNSGDILRNAYIDLRPGGAIIYGDVNVPDTPLWQNIGIVVQLIGENQVRVSGIDMNGTLYALPSDGIGQIAREIEVQLNQRLRQEQIVMSGETFRIQQINSNHEQLTVVLR